MLFFFLTYYPFLVFNFYGFFFVGKVFKGLSENFMLGVYWRSLHGEWLASHIFPLGYV